MFRETESGKSSQICAGGAGEVEAPRGTSLGEVARTVGRGVHVRGKDGAELPDLFLMPSKKWR